MQTDVQAIHALVSEAGRPEWNWRPDPRDEALFARIRALAYEDFRAAYQGREKTARSEQLRTVRATVTAQLAAEAEAAGGVAPEHATVNAMLFELEAKIVRAQILSGEPRIDG